MAKHLDPNWTSQIRGRIQALVAMDENATARTCFKIVCQENMTAAFIVKTLAGTNVPFKVINLGAGVKEITTDVTVCSKCHGTGKC